MNAGFNDFLSKPVQADKLEKMVEKWLPDELSEKAKVLETAAKEKNTDTIKNETLNFLSYWRNFKEKLAVMVSDGNKEDIKDVSELIKLLNRLKLAVEDMEIAESDEIVKSLEKYKYVDNAEKVFSKLLAAVVDLDSELVNELAEELKNELQEGE